ncbi:MAG: ABC transporter substrate-binding protein [Gemmatimonadota bacterium]
MPTRVRTPNLLLLCLSLLAPSCRSGSGPVRFGLALSLSDAGVLPMRLGAELAVRQINDSGGLDGRPLELVAVNDYGDPDSAAAVASRFYDSDVSAVIGGAYSGVTLASAPVYNGGRRPLVQLSPSASAPQLSRAGDYTFRVCPSDVAYGAALARFADQQGYSRAAMLFVNDEYGRGVRHAFEYEYARRGGDLVEVDPLRASAPDVGAYLARIAREHAVDVLILATNQDEGLAVLRQIRASGLKLPVLASDGMVGAERVAPALMEGVFVSSAYLVGDSRGENQRFVAAYRRAYPDAGLPDQGAASSYDAVHLLAGAASGGSGARSRIRERLAGVGSTFPGYSGVVGAISFDSAGDVPSLEAQIGVVRGGELVPANEGAGRP